MAQGLYRLALTHITSTALLADPAYLVANFTTGADEKPWVVGSLGISPPYSRASISLSGRPGRRGNNSIASWTLLLLSEQLDWLIDTYDTQAVTIYTWVLNRNAWVAYQTYASIDILNTPPTNVNDAWARDTVMAFTPGIVAPSS